MWEGDGKEGLAGWPATTGMNVVVGTVGESWIGLGKVGEQEDAGGFDECGGEVGGGCHCCDCS